MPERLLMKGNEALAEAAIHAGCRHYFGYPITPQNEIAAYMSKRMPQLKGVFLQAESEIAAVHMVIGASAAGKRTMTTSSSPGIALKAEGLSYLAGCDLPAVIANIQRGGPGLGSIQPSQADYFLATRAPGHGDFRMLVLAPKSVQEMYNLTFEAFNLADQYRMTVMILTDGILGQMMEPLEMAGKEPEKYGKPWAVTGRNRRPQDALAEGGNGEAAAGKARPKNIINSLFLQPEELEKVNHERFAKYKKIEETETRSETYLTEDAEVIVAAYGAVARVAKNAVDEMRGEGQKVGLIRPITLWPFPSDVFMQAAKTAKAFVAAEMSMGQMKVDVELAVRCTRPVSLCSRVGGVVPTPDDIKAKVKEAITCQ
jgi:2-oxoglutarate ferredoxin oxidoreductase subunit alpha